MDAAEFFDREWPALAPRLIRFLAGAGVAADDREDVVQEAALRLYRAWPTIDVKRGVEPFAKTVALNVWRDQTRRRRNETPLELVADRPSGQPSVEDVAVVRTELSLVGRGLRHLSHRQRDLILAPLRSASEPPSSGSARVARSRARQQLRAWLEAASAVALLVAAAVRRLATDRARHAPAMAMASGAVVLAAVVATSTYPAGPPAGRTPRVAIAVGQLGGRHAVASTTGWRTAVPAEAAQPRSAVAAARSVVSVPPRKPTSVHAGPATARVLADAEFDGVGARVYDRGGDRLPACVMGADSTASQVHAVDAAKCGR